MCPTAADQSRGACRRYTPASLLAITDACGKLGFDDDMLLDKVTTRLLGAIPEMDAAGLHTLVRRPLGLLQTVQRDFRHMGFHGTFAHRLELVCRAGLRAVCRCTAAPLCRAQMYLRVTRSRCVRQRPKT